MRKIEIEGETWGYMIGRNNIVLLSPRDQKKMILTLQTVTGRSVDTIYHGRKKKTTDGMVTPSIIRAFIQKTFPKPKNQEDAA